MTNVNKKFIWDRNDEEEKALTQELGLYYEEEKTDERERREDIQ